MALGAVPAFEVPWISGSRAKTKADDPTTIQRGSLIDRLDRRARAQIVNPLKNNLTATLRRRRNAHRSYRPVFVVGAMGSGTSLLTLSLWQNYVSAAAVRESAREVTPDSFLYSRSVEEFATVREYEESLMRRTSWPVSQGREYLQDLYRSRASGSSDVVIDKGPNANLVRAAFLAECFPQARFVLIFRDPVAVIEGFRRKWRTFGEDSLEASIEFYAAIHDRFLDTMWEFPERVTAVKYETLVEKHDETLSELASSLGLRPRARRRRLERRSNRHGKGIRNVSGGRISVVRDANRGAYARMTASEIETIQRRLGPLHRKLCLAAG